MKWRTIVVLTLVLFCLFGASMLRQYWVQRKLPDTISLPVPATPTEAGAEASTTAAASVDFTAVRPGQNFGECSSCPEMVAIPAGDFEMGSSDAESERDLADETTDPKFFVRIYLKYEHPKHRVVVGRPFGLGKYPVTRGEYAVFARETGYVPSTGCFNSKGSGRNHRLSYWWQNPGIEQSDRDPVVCVSWLDTQAYISWLNGKVKTLASANEAGPYRLPSEAEWEYAARSGTVTARWWGDPIGVGNTVCGGCGSEWDRMRTAPVGSFRSNGFGLYDMLGDVRHWTQDCWNSNFVDAPADGSAWSKGDCDQRVFRGGDWYSFPWIVRSADRSKSDSGPQGRENIIGFRVARTLQDFKNSRAP
jgi:formylglycine-generating enzyme required for sulfatase activity